MGLSINEILNALEHTKTAEQTFEDNLKNEPIAEQEKVASEQPFVVETNPSQEYYPQEEVEKVAELVQQGQVMARAFIAELEKIASEQEAGIEMQEPETDTNGAIEIITKLYQQNFQGE